MCITLLHHRYTIDSCQINKIRQERAKPNEQTISYRVYGYNFLELSLIGLELQYYYVF